MSVRTFDLSTFHLPEREYEGDDRFERADELIREAGERLVEVGREVNEKLAVFNRIQLNAMAAPERRPCFEL
jgi:hypothetical protein